LTKQDPRVGRADRLFSLLVRQRDQRCRRCDVPMRFEDLACHHLIKRRYRKTRWMLEAAVSVCWVCHDYIEKNPYVNESFAISILGSDRFAELNGLARDTRTKVDLDEVIAELREQVAA
jgi:hypothetical protein